MPSRRKPTKQTARRRVPDLNQEVANALGASTGTKAPKPKANAEPETEESKQARGPRTR
jgi:hypothetical protein